MSKHLIALKRLAKWFECQKRILPWRENPSTYRVWISEIMLQQTQVVTVIPYFERFITRFPTVESLAAGNEEDVLLHWAGLGYYSRARNLHKGAKLIAARKGFPTTREGWLEVSGVGDYTAGAILSIAGDQVQPILDGNVERVLSRYRCVDRKQGDAFFKARLWRLAEIVVRKAASQKIRPSVINQALMELGATICTPKSPRCEACPISSACEARLLGKVESYPPRKKPKEWIVVNEEVECLLRFGSLTSTRTPLATKQRVNLTKSLETIEVLLRFRKKGEWRSGLWDLPEKALSLRGSKKAEAEYCGKIETRHVVTRHKIRRTTAVWHLTPKSQVLQAAESSSRVKPHLLMRGLCPEEETSKAKRLQAKTPNVGVPTLGRGFLLEDPSEYRWISLYSPDVPLGSAAKKTLEEVRNLVVVRPFC